LDKAVSDKLGKTEKAVNSEKLDGLDSLMFARSYSEANNDIVPREILNNSSHKQSYIGTISYATEVGLPCTYSKIIYMSHNTNGYGTQIAIPYDGGNYYGIYYRNATGTNWGAWIEMLDTRDRNTILTNDANNCLDSGKAYYCSYMNTKNLPLGDNTDDGIIIPYMHIREQWGFQIYMTWHGTAIYWRKVFGGNWDRWYCIGGGSWNQEVIKDSEQVGKYLRWNHYGKNHVIFDASKGIRPDGQPCNNSAPDNLWTPTYPYLMGFNGHSTYGIKVNGANWADSANSVQGFQFRNNNGILEVLVNGVWLSVGGVNYNNVRGADFKSVVIQEIGGKKHIRYEASPNETKTIIDIQRPCKLQKISYSTSTVGQYYANEAVFVNSVAIIKYLNVYIDDVFKMRIDLFQNNIFVNGIMYSMKNYNNEEINYLKDLEARRRFKIDAFFEGLSDGNYKPYQEIPMRFLVND
ncbi:MAG: pyocin knob domain-containing protein, partial [Peptoanaerobacter stomatis]|uniref:pyocin knob domain-containing protein n=1 Tax=Peptoanaerobacter stomatis TaxID=796937 RepID=UPI003F9F74A8